MTALRVFHSGEQFGVWTVLEDTNPNLASRRQSVCCQCTCGNIRVIPAYRLSQMTDSVSCSQCHRKVHPRDSTIGEVRICTLCEETKHIKAFPRWRTVCKQCLNRNRITKHKTNILTEKLKQCSRCKEEKLAIAFYASMSTCITCESARKREQRETMSEAKRAQELLKFRKHYANNRERMRSQQRRRSRARLFERKCIVINHYGGECACCHEKTIYFLEIDHIDGSGNIHRKTLQKERQWRTVGNPMHAWLIKHDFPPGFRVLCANCNKAFGAWGFCPHQGTGKQLPLF